MLQTLGTITLMTFSAIIKRVITAPEKLPCNKTPQEMSALGSLLLFNSCAYLLKTRSLATGACLLSDGPYGSYMG